MRNIDKLKSYLKGTANQIRQARLTYKEAQRRHGLDGKPAWRYHSILNGLRDDYRHHHIAYCELRGRTRDQIETKPKCPDKAYRYPNEALISKIKEEYAWSPEEIAAYEERKRKNETVRSNS